MKKSNIILIILGLIIFLFAVFSPIAEIHSIAWRIVIGLLGCFSLVSGFYKIARKK